MHFPTLVSVSSSTWSDLEEGRDLRPALGVARGARVPSRLVRRHRAEEDQEGVEAHGALSGEDGQFSALDRAGTANPLLNMRFWQLRQMYRSRRFNAFFGYFSR